MKTCSQCGVEWPLIYFHRKGDGHRAKCKECRNGKERDRYGGLSSYQRCARRLQSRYGITPEQYQRMFIAQRGCCGICERPYLERPLVVDHCHVTSEVRGLLCNQCNTGIGLLGGDETTHTLAAAREWCNPATPNDAQKQIRTTSE